MEPVEVLLIVALGAFLAAWGIAHFHEGQPPEEDLFQRSARTVFLRAGGARVCRLCGIRPPHPRNLCNDFLAMGQVPHFSCYQNPIPSDCKERFESLEELYPDVLVLSALVAAIFIRFVVPNVPILRRPFDRLRDLTHAWALFPFARQRLVSAFSTSDFIGRDNSDAELAEELARYGVAAKWLSFLSRSAKQSLLEAHSLRRRLIALFDRSQAFGVGARQTTSRRKGAQLASDPESETTMKFASSWMLRRFGRARAVAFKELETIFRRVIRRTALALLLVEEISDKVENEALRRSISNFVAEESDDIRIRYRRLVAEAALSCVPHRTERTQFLKYFGYQVPTAPALPLRPWVIVFLLDFLLFLVPSVIIIFTGEDTGEDQLFAPTPLVLFPLIHAISQTVAITWAIYPKVVSNFARPSLYFGRPPLYSLPWQSYIVFGLGSYMTGVVILLLFRLLVPMPYPVIFPTLLSSLNFLLMTIGISLLIDVRLQSRSPNSEQGRVREGFALALLMLINTLTFQLMMFYIGPKLGWVDAKTLVPAGIGPETLKFIRTSFLLLSPGLGFIIGYFVPAATAAFLHRAKLLRFPGPLDRSFGPGGDRRESLPAITASQH